MGNIRAFSKRQRWSDEEVAILRTAYTTASRSQLRGLFPSRSVQNEARANQPHHHTMTPPPGWKKVSFAADCDGYDEETVELGDICSICGLDYCEECECPGPTQEDEFEYQEFDGVLYARPTE